MQNPSFFAVLPASVRYDARLSASEKIFFAEITSLTEAEGYCYANNAYFSQLYGTSERTVQRWLGRLQGAGYIQVEPAQAGPHPHPRRIYLAQGGSVRGAEVDEAVAGGDKNVAGGDKNVGEGVTKMSPPTSKNNKNKINTGARAGAKAPTPEEGPKATAENGTESQVRAILAGLAGEDAQLLAALEDFAEHRKAKKKPLTPLAARRLVNKLVELVRDADARDPHDYMRAALDTSIRNGWTDVYAVKEYRPGAAKPAPANGRDRPRVIPADADAAELF